MLTNEHLMSLNLPKNFEISIFANNIESPRQMAETKNGFVIVGSKSGQSIYALHDNNNDGTAEIKILIAMDLYQILLV